MYKYYLLPDAKKDLDRASQLERTNALDTIEKLKNGLCGGGTRVKKLHGLSRTKCIYEAREDSGKRLLFTVGEKGVGEETPLYIHNVCIEHDKVIRRAQKIIGDDFILEVYNDLKEISNVTAEDLLEEEKKYPEQNYIFAMIDDMGCFEITEDDVYRFAEQESVTQEESIAFRLKLSKEQKEVLNKPLPKLISGTAGSGKTTVLLYNLMIQPEKKKLYITSNKELCNESRNLFYRLIKDSDYEDKFKQNTEFKTFEDLIYEGLGKGIRKTVTKEKFIFEYEKYSRGLGANKEFEPLKIWEEIRSVWKSRDDKKSITLDEYIGLTELEAPNFYKNREKAYRIYQWYEKFLKDNLYYDEIDLIKEYLKENDINKQKYEFVVCDEVQDLTTVHMSLVFFLTNNNPQNTIIAGDDHQIINQSGFRWEKLKQYYYNEYNLKTELHTLNKNYRCIGNIANLANEINKLQEKFVEKKYKVQGLDSIPYGNKPELITRLEEDELIDELRDLGPLRAIIVKEMNDKKKLKDSFINKYGQSPLIFSIEEAKGLEFESVVLWKLISGDKENKNKWEKVFRTSRWNDNKQLKDFIKYNSSLIYVAITRAMRGCIIYEDKNTEILWNEPGIKENINKVNLLNKSILGIEEEVTDEDWLFQGIQLIKKKHYEIARECFERIKDSNIIDERNKYIKVSYAKELMDKHCYEEAGDIFKEIKDESSMEECYDLAGCYNKNYNYYIAKGRKKEYYEKVKEYGIKWFDQEKQWNRSAIYCFQNKLYNDSISRYEKLGDFKRIAEIYLNQLNNPVQAIKYYNKSGEFNNDRIKCLLYERMYAKNYSNINHWESNKGKYIRHNSGYELGIIEAVNGKIVSIKFLDEEQPKSFSIDKIDKYFDFANTRDEKLNIFKLIEKQIINNMDKEIILQEERLKSIFNSVKGKLKLKKLVSYRCKDEQQQEFDDNSIEYLVVDNKVAKGYMAQSIDYYTRDDDTGKEIIQDQLWILESGEIVKLIYHYCTWGKNQLGVEEWIDFPEKDDENFQNFNYELAINNILLDSKEK